MIAPLKSNFHLHTTFVQYFFVKPDCVPRFVPPLGTPDFILLALSFCSQIGMCRVAASELNLRPQKSHGVRSSVAAEYSVWVGLKFFDPKPASWSCGALETYMA